MAKIQIPRLAKRLSGVIKAHFAYTAVYMLTIVVFDAWNLITPSAIVDRWLVASLLLIVTSITWYVVKQQYHPAFYYHVLAYALILVDLFVATFSVYTQRGIASKAVLLYVIPIATAVVLYSRAAVLAISLISIALYSAANVYYFYEHPGQAYKVELYGETIFYGAVLVLVAYLMWILQDTKTK